MPTRVHQQRASVDGVTQVSNRTAFHQCQHHLAHPNYPTGKAQSNHPQSSRGRIDLTNATIAISEEVPTTLGTLQRLASHASIRTRYCEKAPKITDPVLPRPPPFGRTQCTYQPQPLGTTDYSFRPTEHCLHSYHRAACPVEWSTGIQSASKPPVELLPTYSRSCR